MFRVRCAPTNGSNVGSISTPIEFQRLDNPPRATGYQSPVRGHWLWIADLSQPEQLAVRILPVLMIATQLLVAKITPSPAGADPRMARLMKLMPLVLGIVLYQQPSALMLYWLTSNLPQLAQQWWLGKRYA